MRVQFHIGHNFANKARVIDEVTMHGRADISPECFQIDNVHSETADTEERFRLGELKICTSRECTGEVVGTLPWRKIDMLCTGDKSLRCIS